MSKYTATHRSRRRHGARVSMEELRRSELIEATIRTISEVGFENSTIRDIARAASASTGSVHYYFATKDDLLQAAVAQGDERFYDVLSRQVSDIEGAAAKLGRIADLCFPLDESEGGPDWNVFIDFLQQAVRRPEFRLVFERANARWIDLLSSIIEAGVAAQELRLGGSARHEAIGLTAMIDGLAIHTRAMNIDVTEARAILHERIRSISTAADPTEIVGTHLPPRSEGAHAEITA